MCKLGGCPILPGIIFTGKGGVLRIGNSNVSPTQPSPALPPRATSNEGGHSVSDELNSVKRHEYGAARQTQWFCLFIFSTRAFCQDLTRSQNRPVDSVAPPSISSASYRDHDSLLRTPRPLPGGRVPTQTLGLKRRPRNDSGCPARVRRDAARTVPRTFSFPAASSTSSPLVCVRPSLWPPPNVCALSAGHSPAATLHRTAPRSGLLLPVTCASWCSLAC